MVGGLFYFNYPRGTGLTSGAVFGRIAGLSASKLSWKKLEKDRTASNQPGFHIGQRFIHLEKLIKLEDNHTASNRPGFHIGKRFIHLGQFDAFGYHFIQMQFPGKIEIYKPGHINAETIGPHH